MHMQSKIAYSVIYLLIALTLFAVLSSNSVTISAADRLVNVTAPSIAAVDWLNTGPLDNVSLKGKVYLVEFWTYGCYNCRNVEPYIKKWHAKYQQQGFEVVAVHSPEFAHEADITRVSAYLKRNGITYPVAIDNDFAIWKRYSNRYWPAMYLVDKQGKIRYSHFGEGRYAATEAMINALLQE
jgi:thiol-disulfide isomerase/thioredoxin